MSIKETMESKDTVEETTIDTAPGQETNTDDSKVDEDDSKKQETSDYKAELEKAQAQLEKAEKKIVKLKKDGKDTQAAELDLESIKKELREELLSEVTGVVQKDKVETLVGTVAENDDEAELIRFHLEKSIKSTGDAMEDVRRAKALANVHKTESEKEAMREVLRAERTKNTSPAFSGRKVVEDKQPNYTAAEKKLLQRVGLIK